MQLYDQLKLTDLINNLEKKKQEEKRKFTDQRYKQKGLDLEIEENLAEVDSTIEL